MMQYLAPDEELEVDEKENHKFYSGAGANKTGVLSTVATWVTLTTAGWYHITADEHFVVTGPFSTSSSGAAFFLLAVCRPLCQSGNCNTG